LSTGKRTDGSGPRPEERESGADDIEKLQREVEEEKQRTLRLLAEFDNFRRRVTREQDMARDQGRGAALRALLPVLDTLEQALEAGSKDKAFFDGVAATRRLFLDALREAGAEPIPSVGMGFDPQVHEVVQTAPSDDAEPGTVLRELRRGWRLGGELLRPAQVEVAAARESSDPWP
jgi:molecular chaperone GrpE